MILRDLLNCVHLGKQGMFSLCCLCNENVAIGFKTSIETYFVKQNKNNSARTPELLEVSKLCHNF